MNIKIKSSILKNIQSLDFKCSQCSICCRKDPGIVLLTKQDFEKLRNHLSMSEKEFLEQCCREVYKDNKTLISLKEKVNYDCIFWNNGCIVYEARPLQCKTYPFWPSVLESKKSIENEKKRCKGIGIKSNLSLQDKIDFYLEEKNAVYMEYSKTNK